MTQDVEAVESVNLILAPTGAEETTVIDHSMYGAVRTLWAHGQPKKASARQLGLDIKTVRKWLAQAWSPQRRPRPSSETKLEPFKEFLLARAPEVGCNGVVLYRESRARGYTGSYASLARYLQPLRGQWRGGPEATVRFETAPGEQAQVDWGQTKAWLGQSQSRIHVFTMVLGYSRRIFACAFLHEGLENLLRGHELAFEHFGGRTATILYDNPRTIVLSKDEAGGQVEWNRRFKDCMDYYGVTIRLCRYYRAQTKGKVESGVKYVKGNALAGQTFRDLEDLNTYLLDWCLNIADQRVHGTTHEKPAERFARAERQALTPTMSRPPVDCGGWIGERTEVRRVPRDAYVAVETNRYPVAYEWVGRSVAVQIGPDRIVLQLRSETAGKLESAERIVHARLTGRHQVARWPGVPRTLPQLPQAAKASKAAVAGTSGSPLQSGLPEPPRFDALYLQRVGQVEIRSLAGYAQLCEEVTL